MTWRRAATVAATTVLFLAVPTVFAGGTYYNGSAFRAAPAAAAAPAVVSRTAAAPTTISIAVTPTRATVQPTVVSIRGLDGAVRQFPVEGGQAGIETRQVVIYAGQSVTVKWVATK